MSQDPTKIYVVDDERVIASTLALILQKNGYNATPFFDPSAVLEASIDAPPDVLISDVVMPQMTGVDLAIRMGQEHPTCEVILFSGQAKTSMYLDDARTRGYDFTVLPKPLHPVDLLAFLDGRGFRA